MAFPEQEVPLILIIFLGSLGSAFILIYRNFLCPKQPTALIQKVSVGLSLLSAFLSITSVLSPNRTLILFNWILSGFLILYSLFSLFLPPAYSRGMLTWSDVFLVGLAVSFFFMRIYASMLLIYDRARQKKDLKSLSTLRPIPKPFDLDTVDYPMGLKISSTIPPTI